jgi:DNA polymerase III delta subunit
MTLLVVQGPSNAGPGERERMLDAATAHLAAHDVEPGQTIRIDVPGRGAGEEGEGGVRAELEPMIPLLQSGSLFGGRQGLVLVDAQNLQRAEVDSLVGLLESADLASTVVVLIATGTLAKPLVITARDRGSTVTISKMWERDATKWLGEEVRHRKLQMDQGAAKALIRRHGSDTAGLGQALDQLGSVPGKITEEMVLDRFKNRPEEPAWHITDAIGKGDVREALRRLSDFLVHGHPLVYLATLETDLKRRALAAAAPDEETFKAWVGGGSDRQLGVMWNRRSAVRESSLRRAQQALLRADRVLKTHPEEVHRVTLERLTVALCKWYG